ncbi:MAG: phosphoglycolate phosphatase [Pseudomonadota bacterium]
MNIGAIAFDLDGTLVDSVPDLAFATNAAMHELGHPPHPEDTIRNWVGNGVQRLVERAITGRFDGRVSDSEIAAAVSVFERHYAVANGVHSTVFDGVFEGLDAVRSLHLPLACVTNKPEQPARALLSTCGLADYFPCVVGGDTLPRRKPDPLPLTHIAAHFGVTPPELLVVGDSVSDVQAARAAGCSIIAVSYGYNHGRDIRSESPDHVVGTIAEVPGLLAGMKSGRR